MSHTTAVDEPIDYEEPAPHEAQNLLASLARTAEALCRIDRKNGRVLVAKFLSDFIHRDEDREIDRLAG
jgi:hypothetical protein